MVPVTKDWHRTAMHGMHAVTSVWGGAGFVVIPVGPVGVHSAVIAALREYDPDSVLMPPPDSLMREEQWETVA